ncbi:MAG: hypothetical protein KDK55_00140 [Chlamydiia bacterium]|nr:hypothetical protein [Chlamydiia bacterium]
MQVGHRLQFNCQACGSPILFSVLDVQEFSDVISCSECGKRYSFDDKKLLRQLRQFEALCRQIHASKEILGSTAIAIDVGSHHVQVPFNILLTRLSSVIELSIGGKKSVIAFRIEPLEDIPAAICLTSSCLSKITDTN